MDGEHIQTHLRSPNPETTLELCITVFPSTMPCRMRQSKNTPYSILRGVRATDPDITVRLAGTNLLISLTPDLGILRGMKHIVHSDETYLRYIDVSCVSSS